MVGGSSALLVEPDSFVGRERELADLAGLLHRARLVSLVGPGGVGKTRLAKEAARRLAYEFGEVWLVDLSSAGEGGNAAASVAAAAVGVREVAGADPVDTLVRALAGHRGLLVVDNCEQVVEQVCDLLARLLAGCPRVRVLATSQVVLEVRGEVVYLLGGLELPVADAGAGSWVDTAAVRLFVDRAREVASGFEPTPGVAEICTRLDGLPLYVELAARWVRVLSVAEIGRELADHRFDLLRVSGRGVAARHRSLRAVIEYSYRLLDAREQEAFRRLAAPPGGFDLDAATAAVDEELSRDEVLALLYRLQAKSLVVRSEAGGVTRFRMLESIRLFGLECLEAAGETKACQARLVDWYAAGCQRIWQMASLSRALRSWLAAERDNLAAAVDWARTTADDRLVPLAAGLVTSWSYVGWNARGAALLAELADTTAGTATVEDRYALSFLSARLAIEQSDHRAADAFARQALELARTLNEPIYQIKAFYALAELAAFDGEHEASIAYAEQVVALAAGLDRPRERAASLTVLVGSLIGSGDWSRAGTVLDEAIPVLREHADDESSYIFALIQRGSVARAAGEFDLAESSLLEAFTVAGADRQAQRDSLFFLAEVAAERGQAERALRLAGAAAAVRTRAIGPHWVERVDKTLQPCREALGPAAATVSEEGSRLTLEQAIAYARDGTLPGQDVDEAALSRRELEVAHLVSEGLTNHEIAARLTLSNRSIDTHLEHIRIKLGLRSRAEITAWLARGD